MPRIANYDDQQHIDYVNDREKLIHFVEQWANDLGCTIDHDRWRELYDRVHGDRQSDNSATA